MYVLVRIGQAFLLQEVVLVHPLVLPLFLVGVPCRLGLPREHPIKGPLATPPLPKLFLLGALELLVLFADLVFGPRQVVAELLHQVFVYRPALGIATWFGLGLRLR